MYLGYGRGRQAEQELRPQRGQWLDQKGQVCSHEEVMEWVNQAARENLVTHQFILSVKELQLSPEAFNRAMAAGSELFQEWRLIGHNDSRFSHAHALAFGQREVQLKSEAFRAWWQEVRQALEQEQQQAREQQLQLEQAQRLERGQEPELSIEQTGRERSEERSLEQDTHELSEEQEQQLDTADLLLEMDPAEEQQRGWGLGL
jgi:hypothetical protein